MALAEIKSVATTRHVFLFTQSYEEDVDNMAYLGRLHKKKRRKATLYGWKCINNLKGLAR
jgi:hypothetical protein